MTARLASLSLILLSGTVALAGVPGLMNFQGLLKDTNGDPVADGSYFVTFRIYPVPAGGSPVWADTQTVSTADGLFNVIMGQGTPLPDSAFNSTDLYLGISVFPNAEMVPRQQFTTSAYSFRTAQIGTNSMGYVPRWDGFALVAGSIYDDGGNIGIGTNAPTAKLQVAGIVYSSQAGGGFRFPDGSLQTTAASPGAIVYTRWGRSDCPGGSSLVYAGVTGGKHYQHGGGGTNLLCMSLSPTWDVFSDVSQNGALLYGTEYETIGYGVSSLTPNHDFEVPCAVCLKEPASVVLMQPGRQLCPAGWSLEYAGYLMSTHYTQTASEFVCVDRLATSTGSASNSNGSLLFPTEAECGALPCPAYIQDREITCSVCSK